MTADTMTLSRLLFVFALAQAMASDVQPELSSLDFEAEPSLDAAIDGSDGDAFESIVDSVVSNAERLCAICGIHPRVHKQVFCSMGCESDIKAAYRDAKAQGPAQAKAYSALRRTGGASFVAAVMAFKARCTTVTRGGRKPGFAWSRYLMIIRMSTVVHTGMKQLWLGRKAFIRFIVEDRDVNEPQVN